MRWGAPLYPRNRIGSSTAEQGAHNSWLQVRIPSDPLFSSTETTTFRQDSEIALPSPFNPPVNPELKAPSVLNTRTRQQKLLDFRTHVLYNGRCGGASHEPERAWLEHSADRIEAVLGQHKAPGAVMGVSSRHAISSSARTQPGIKVGKVAALVEERSALALG